MLNSFWNWFVIIITVASILGCWWLLYWTKGVSDREEDKTETTGHVWDEDLKELNNPLPRWWLHLFNITIVFAFAYLIIFPGLGNFSGFKGWSQEQQWEQEIVAAEAAQETIYARFREMEPEQLIADQEAREIGGRLFGNNCAMCHGSDMAARLPCRRWARHSAKTVSVKSSLTSRRCPGRKPTRSWRKPGRPVSR